MTWRTASSRTMSPIIASEAKMSPGTRIPPSCGIPHIVWDNFLFAPPRTRRGGSPPPPVPPRDRSGRGLHVHHETGETAPRRPLPGDGVRRHRLDLPPHVV